MGSEGNWWGWADGLLILAGCGLEATHIATAGCKCWVYMVGPFFSFLLLFVALRDGEGEGEGLHDERNSMLMRRASAL